jgi:TRAP-type C4-dicarboxylate transport system permease small subunit
VPTVSSRFSSIAAAVDRVSSSLNAVAEFVLWVLVALTIVVTFVQVVFRYGLDSSLSWSEELARYLFVWIIFIGTSVATRRKKHIFVEVLVALMPCTLRVWANLLSVAASVVFFSVFAYVGWLLMLNAWQQYSTALDIRIAWVYATAPIGAALSVLHLIAGQLQRWTGNEKLSPPSNTAAEGLE